METTADVLAELPSIEVGAATDELAPKSRVDPLPGQDRARQILAAVDFAATDTDKIIERTGLPAAAVLATLMQLELLELIAECPGGFSRLR